jgi:hypothetical protein
MWAISAHKTAVGKLQLTAGFSLAALQRLLSGEQLGSIESWPPAATADYRQYLHGYARQDHQAPRLYRTALQAVRDHRLHEGGGRGSMGKMAAILAVMAQPSISFRGGTYDYGQMLAKTNYAKLLSMAHDEGMHFTGADLLNALLDVVNAHIAPDTVTANSPVIPTSPPVNLGKVTFREWVNRLVPRTPRTGRRPKPVDLMTQAAYPGTAGEKAGLRAFGPYRHADPGRGPDDAERAIFELRSIMTNPVTDLRTLVGALVFIMQDIHRTGRRR